MEAGLLCSNGPSIALLTIGHISAAKLSECTVLFFLIVITTHGHFRSYLVLAIFGEICTHGLLYSVGRLPDRATDWEAYKKPKVQKMTGITGLFEP